MSWNPPLPQVPSRPNYVLSFTYTPMISFSFSLVTLIQYPIYGTFNIPSSTSTFFPLEK